MSIDKSKINVGDQVKAMYSGFVTDGWVTVEKYEHGAFGRFDRVIGDNIPINLSSVEITDHKPGFAELEDAVIRAECALADAKDALAKAKNSDPLGLIGKIVRFKSSRDLIGLVTAYNDSVLYPDTYTIDGMHYHPERLEVVN